MKRIFSFIAAAALFFWGTAAWAQSVSAYTTLEEPLAKALFEQYKTETGVTVSFVRLAGGETITRM